MRKRLHPRLLWLLKFLVVFYLTSLAILYVFQRELLFRPWGSEVPPTEAGLPATQVLTLTAEDGTALRAWYQPPATPEGRVVIFFHGNGGRLASYARVMKPMAAQGLGFLAVTYRGYPGSEGSPSEEGLYEDARAALRYADEVLKIPSHRRILMGLSLGTGVATQMATESDASLLVLVAPYTSIREVAGGVYWYVPVRYLLRDTFDSLARAAHIRSMPVLIFHGEEDKLIPFAQGQRIFAEFPGEKKFFPLKKQGHNDMDFGFILQEVAAYRVSLLAQLWR